VRVWCRSDADWDFVSRRYEVLWCNPLAEGSRLGGHRGHARAECDGALGHHRGVATAPAARAHAGSGHTRRSRGRYLACHGSTRHSLARQAEKERHEQEKRAAADDSGCGHTPYRYHSTGPVPSSLSREVALGAFSLIVFVLLSS
jgi:hypothetical protein